MRKADYPPNWHLLRLEVGARSRWRCEQECDEGPCDAENGTRIHRLKAERSYYVECTIATAFRCSYCDDPEWFAPIRVVLTVAHLCHDSHCDDIEHMRHLCQLHHLRYDAQQHGASAARTRAMRRQAAQS